MTSPLKPASTVLKVFQFLGGFPLTPTDDTWTEFKFWKFTAPIHFVFFVLPLLVHTINGILIALSLENISDFMNVWTRYGMTTIDLIAVLMLLWIHITTAFILLLLFRRSSKPISKLCKIMALQNARLGIEENHLKGLTLRSYGAMLTLFLLHFASALASMPYANKVMTNEFDSVTFIPFSYTWVLIILIYYWPFPAAVSLLVNRQCMFGLMLQLDALDLKLKKLLGSENEEDELMDEKSVSANINHGLNIRHAIDVANDTLGGFLLLDVCMCIFVTIITIYFTPLIIDSLTSNNQINIVQLSYGLHCFFLALKAGIRWINYYKAGQMLSNKCKNVKNSLEDILIEHHDHLSEAEKTKLALLINRYDDDAPLKPLGSFKLNLPTAISTAGLVATYLVILVQFKQSNIDLTLQKWKEEVQRNKTLLLSTD